MIPIELFCPAEGYLALGMYAEANAALETMDKDCHLTERWMRLRAQALAGIGDQEGARIIQFMLESIKEDSERQE